MKINKNHFRVAIFGSARTKKNDPQYALVNTLARLIAQNRMDIVTGGGPGLMDAASKSHHKGSKGSKGKNLHSVGLTIWLPREQHDGYHLDIKKEFKRFSGRLDKFMQLSNVVVVAPGGIGTLLEFMYAWQLVQVKHICNLPIILLGDMWSGLLEWMRKEMLRKNLVSKKDFDSIFIAKNCSQAMQIINETKEKFNQGKFVCNNLTKYK